jgi:hypothetical protein
VEALRHADPPSKEPDWLSIGVKNWKSCESPRALEPSIIIKIIKPGHEIGIMEVRNDYKIVDVNPEEMRRRYKGG